jgi:hypothetical protein
MKKKIMQQKCVISKSEMGIVRFGRMETDEDEDNATEMCNKQSEMGIGIFGRMETDEDEDNATEMCSKQSEMCFVRFGK